MGAGVVITVTLALKCGLGVDVSDALEVVMTLMIEESVLDDRTELTNEDVVAVENDEVSDETVDGNMELMVEDVVASCKVENETVDGNDVGTLCKKAGSGCGVPDISAFQNELSSRITNDDFSNSA